MTICKHPGCDSPTAARGYCMRHYKQARAGTLRITPEVGSPDGYGHYGILDETSEGMLCHECGGRYQSLGSHVYRTHGIRAVDYKDTHGIPRGIPLITTDLHERQSAHAHTRLGTQGWRAFEEARDPTAASHARTIDSYATAGSTTQERREKSIANLAKATRRGRRPRACAVCGTDITQMRRGVKCCSPLCRAISKYEARHSDWAKAACEARARGASDYELAKRYHTSTAAVRAAIDAHERWVANRAELDARLHGG